MGNEAECTARIGSRRVKGRALLETRELIFRGDARAVFAFEKMRGVAAMGSTLSFEHAGERVEIDVGPQAAKWAEKIRNPKSRIDKLGVKAGHRVRVVGVDDDALEGELIARGAAVVSRGECDAVFLGVSSASDLRQVAAVRSSLKPDGALWLIRPKGAGAGVGELEVMAAGKAAGLVDVKVVAFSATHSALKFVVPVAKRK